jgi:hypothetical protein
MKKRGRGKELYNSTTYSSPKLSASMLSSAMRACAIDLSSYGKDLKQNLYLKKGYRTMISSIGKEKKREGRGQGVQERRS